MSPLRNFSRFGLAAFFLVLCVVSLVSAPAASKLNVVTSTTDLAALAEEIGGDRISVESIARGYQDPHFVEAKPSFLLKLRKADLLIVVGL
jgi:ABC-type Zn uptake system ZnuABC Zn-binding protein ZnuA